MPNPTFSEYWEMRRRLEAGKKNPQPEKVSAAVEREFDLHTEIIAYCNSQWPRWKYIHANPSRRSTIQTGACDFTIFLPDGKLLCVECKDKDGKLDKDQQIWAKEMEMLGHTVYVVRSMRDFLDIL